MTRLEERLAHQEVTIAELGDVLHRQQLQIDRLVTLCRQLAERVAAMQQGRSGDPLDEKPPHY